MYRTQDFIYRITFFSAFDQYFCYGREDGLYPDPDSCAQYYLCNGGLTNIMSCSTGKHWNQAIYKCDLPENVDCEAQAREALEEEDEKDEVTEGPHGLQPDFSCKSLYIYS